MEAVRPGHVPRCRRSDIDHIELLQADEAELTPGTWVQVDVVGVTAEGRHVAGLRPGFEVEDDRYAGYFAYQYDPEFPAQTLHVRVFDQQITTEFRGGAVDQKAKAPKKRRRQKSEAAKKAKPIGAVRR